MPDGLVDKALNAGAGLRAPADNEGGRGNGRLRAFPGLGSPPVSLSDWFATDKTPASRAAVSAASGKAGK
eukprot:12040739-Alexandrium_andersonii.AAC.1